MDGSPPLPQRSRDQAVSSLSSPQVKADKDSGNLRRLQQASRGVTQGAAAVVASTKSGKSQIEDTGERHFDWVVVL